MSLSIVACAGTVEDPTEAEPDVEETGTTSDALRDGFIVPRSGSNLADWDQMGRIALLTQDKDVLVPNLGGGKCVGLYLGARTVVTAAHCIEAWARDAACSPNKDLRINVKFPNVHRFINGVRRVTSVGTTASEGVMLRPIDGKIQVHRDIGFLLLDDSFIPEKSFPAAQPTKLSFSKVWLPDPNAIAFGRVRNGTVFSSSVVFKSTTVGPNPCQGGGSCLVSWASAPAPGRSVGEPGDSGAPVMFSDKTWRGIMFGDITDSWSVPIGPVCAANLVRRGRTNRTAWVPFSAHRELILGAVSKMGDGFAFTGWWAAERQNGFSDLSFKSFERPVGGMGKGPLRPKGQPPVFNDYPDSTTGGL